MNKDVTNLIVLHQLQPSTFFWYDLFLGDFYFGRAC